MVFICRDGKPKFAIPNHARKLSNKRSHFDQTFACRSNRKIHCLRTYFSSAHPNLFILKGSTKYYTIEFRECDGASNEAHVGDELNRFVDLIMPYLGWDLIY